MTKNPIALFFTCLAPPPLAQLAALQRQPFDHHLRVANTDLRRNDPGMRGGLLGGTA